MKTLKFLVVFLVVSASVFSQSKRVADRFFKEFAYVKSARLYETIYKKGDSSTYVLKRIGDSYYNNVDTKRAEYWYEKLVNKEDNLDEDYLFKYAQTLRSNGKYKKSDSILSVITPINDVAGAKEDLTGQKYMLDFSESMNRRISFRNLAINTPFSDFGGFIKGNEAYFASASPRSKNPELYKWNKQPFLNIYKATNYIQKLEDSEKDSILVLYQKNAISSSVNTQFHESTPIFTKDGRYMYFTRVNYDGNKLRKDKNKTINLKLYRAESVNGKWTNVDELAFDNDEYSVGHPALSPDEKTLYFVSDMPGGIGKTDIYKVSVIDHKTYGDPINLGETINTPEKEMFPFIGTDNTLYFSSNGHIGVGLLDVFQTKILEDDTYDKPLNLGFPFNSKRDDFAFYIDETGRQGFVSSNRENGKGDDDIYSFIINGDLKPINEPEEEPEPEVCTEIITGVVRSKHKNQLLPYATVKLVDTNGELLGEVFSDEKGVYIFEDIPCLEKKYLVNGSKQDFKPDTNKANTTGKKGNVTKADLTLTPLIIGNQIVISPIYFDYNSATIRDDAQYELENIVTVMGNHSDMIIKIESHTDSRGSNVYNRSLSDRRAKSTRDYLISRGIKLDRIESAIGFGEDQLLNHCDDANKRKCTEEEHQLNRRSYFYIVKGGIDVDIVNKKPTVIDKSLLIQKQKLLKDKILIEKLNKFRKGRATRKTDDKCRRDSDCS